MSRAIAIDDTTELQPHGGVELLGIERLEEHARRLAGLFTVGRRPHNRRRAHLRRLNDNMRVLRATYRALADDARRASRPRRPPNGCSTTSTSSRPPRATSAHDLPPSFFRRLPTIAADEFAGLPRIYALALELIRCSAGSLDAQRLHRFITAFQSVTPLTIGELWAWPSALKLALVEHLRVRGRRPGRRPRASAAGRSRRRAHSRARVTLRRPVAGTRSIRPSSPGCCSARREYGATAATLRQQLDATLVAQRGDRRGRHPRRGAAPGGRAGDRWRT